MAISSFRGRARALSAGATALLASVGAVTVVAVSSAGAHAVHHANVARAGCATSALKVSLGRGDGALGSIYYPLKFTNRSARACTLRGDPGISAISRSGNQIGSPALRDQSNFRTVTLLPGKQREATVRIVDTGAFSKASCRPVISAALRIFPPNQTHSLTIGAKFSVCSKKSEPSMEVLPVE